MITKDEFVNNLKNQLDDLNGEIGKIEQKAKLVKAEAKAKVAARIKYLKEMHDSVQAKVQEVKDAGKEAWQDMKLAAENLVNAYKSALTKTLAHFKKRRSEIVIDKFSD